MSDSTHRFDGGRVAARRIELNLTVTQVAAAVGINEAAMRQIEANRGPDPRIRVVIRLLDVLDVRLEDLCAQPGAEPE